MGMKRFQDLTDAQLLAVCLYGEARGETDCGKIAVASVIKERVKKGGLVWHGVSRCHSGAFSVLMLPDF